MTTISAVVYPEADQWVAQCVEYDIGAQAATMEDLFKRFDAAVYANLNESLRRSDVPFDGIDPAPQEVRDIWENCGKNVPPARSMKQNDVFIDMHVCTAA